MIEARRLPTSSRVPLSSLLHAFEDPAAFVTADGDLLSLNPAWRIHGFSDASFADGRWEPVEAVLAGRVDHRSGVGRRPGRDGWRWYRSRVRSIDDVAGAAAVLVHRDITTERRLFQRMAGSPAVHLDLDPTGALLSVNERWEQLRGRPVGAELGFRWLRDTPEAQQSELTDRLAQGRAFEMEVLTAGVDDRRLPLSMSFEPIRDGDELIGWSASATDRSDLVALETANERALVDSVTGLAGRVLFETTLSRKLAGRHDGRVGLLFVDLDGFKAVNDRLGHGAGDKALETIAARLAGVLRPDDLIARYGGDEFAVMIDGIEPDMVHEIAERLVEQGRTPVVLAEEQEQFHVGVSVGVARSRPGDDLDSLIDRADQAMYRAKRAGGGRIEVAGDS